MDSFVRRRALAQQRSALHSNQQSSRQLLIKQQYGEEFSFLTDFVSEDIMLEFFGYQPQQVSETMSDSYLYGGGMAEIASGGHSSSIGQQSNDELRLTGKKTPIQTQQNQQGTGSASLPSGLMITSWKQTSQRFQKMNLMAFCNDIMQ